MQIPTCVSQFLVSAPYSSLATEAEYHCLKNQNCFLVGLSLLSHPCLLLHFMEPHRSGSHLEI